KPARRGCACAATTTTLTSGCWSYRIRSMSRRVSPTKCAPAGLDHAPGDARAGVAGGLRRVVVRVGVDDQPSADDVAGPLADRDAAHRHVDLRAPVLDPPASR